MNTLDAALLYRSRGWFPLDVPRRTKRPVRKEWQSLRLDEEQIRKLFGNGLQPELGIILGVGLGGPADVDLDVPEAIAAADYYLPATPAVFGRPSKPRSHRVYRIAGESPGIVQFEDPPSGPQANDGATLVELRGRGGQTIFPPSTHESGERIEWAAATFAPEPAEAPAADLLHAVQRIAAVALIARRWPGHARHKAALALVGGLVRAGWSDGDIEQFVRAVAHAARDEELGDRLRAIRDTAGKIRSGGRATGWRTLSDLTGHPRGISKVREWLGCAGADEAPETRPQVSATDDNLTELGLAERLVRKHGTDLRYVFPWNSWLAWDGKRWAIDREGTVAELLKGVVRDLTILAAHTTNAVLRSDLLKFIPKAERDSAMRGALALARSAVAVLPEALDVDTWLVNTPTGTLDLRTGDVRPHSRDDYLTKLCPTPYDPDATAPTFERFLVEILGVETALYLQRAFGYSLTGTCRENVLFLLVGTGANGKSTLTGAIRRTLGRDYAVKIAPGLLFDTRQKDAHPTGLADLAGKRFAVTHELDSGTRLAEGLCKEATGKDPLKARRMRQDFFEFEPTHTLFVAANSRPVVRGTDDGIWRRLRLVPFLVQISEERQDKALDEKLDREAPGVLRWLADGARAWQEQGLAEPDAVREATACYRDEQDLLGDFLATECVLDPAARCQARELYDRYTTWHKATLGGEPWSNTTFGRRLTDRGLEPRKMPGGIKFRLGVGVR